MGTKNELLKKLENGYKKFSKGQKKLADFIRGNYDKAAFLTAAKMGEEVGVSESTVVRFAMALGYEGYPEFQKALGELIRTKLNSIQRMEECIENTFSIRSAECVYDYGGMPITVQHICVRMSE